MSSYTYGANVAQNGRHLFATRTDYSMWDFGRIVTELQKKFPETEGYAISIIGTPNYSTRTEPAEFLADWDQSFKR